MFERTALYAESWNVAWRKKATGSILTDLETKFNIIENSVRYWAADPFLFKYEGDIYIFAELYDYSKCRGGLGYCRWNGNGFGKWKKVISEPYHLSYPFIFEIDGEIYIMPESGENHSLYLYQAVSFPDIWKRKKTIRKNVIYGDTTPFIWNDHRYALAYDVHDIHDYKLVLLDLENYKNDYIIDNLRKPELRRPAGKMFNVMDTFVRPAQNCVDDYGKSLVFYRYQIGKKGYEEEMILERMPEELKFSRDILLDGMHTYNSIDDFEVIDIKTRRLNYLNFIFRILRKIRR